MRYFESLFRPFTNKKIKTKLLGIYLIVTVIPIFLVGIYLNHSVRNVVLKNAINEVDANVDKLEMRLDTTLNRAINISDLIYINQDLKKIIGQVYESDLEIYNTYQTHRIFDEYLKYYHEVENIRFFMTKDMITDSHFVYADEEIQRESWYQTAIKNNGRISWGYITDQWTDKQYLTLTRAIYGESHELLGVLNIYIAPSNLTKIFEKELFPLYISLDQERIVHSNRKELIGMKPYFTREDNDPEDHSSYIFDDQFMNDEVKVYLRSFQPNKTLENNIQITAIIPIQDVIKDANSVLFKGYTIVIISIVISVTLFYLFIRSFDRRIYTLRHAMDNVAKGNFEIEKRNLGEDEIAQVYHDLELTVESIQQLINKVYIHQINEEQWKRRQKESEFKMLASQINPHFLYNTLEMIRMKALINDDREVAYIVKLLSKMMRSSLEVTDQPIMLTAELDLVRTYLEIQKMRFGDHLHYDIQTSNDIDHYTIFPLLIQPVVENSVIHGIGHHAQDVGSIQVTVDEKDGYLHIQVQDNGRGIEPAKLKHIVSELDQVDEQLTKTSHIGLHNINKRIKLYYGDRYGIKIASDEDAGTTVTLFLPLQKGMDENATIIDH